MMADKTYRDTLHSARLRRLDAGDRVLDHDAALRRHTETGRGDLEHLRIRLAALRVLHRDDCTEETLTVRQTQDQVEIGTRGAGADRLLEAGRVQALQQGPRSRQQRHALSRRGPVKLLLAISKIGNGALVGTVTKEDMNNLRIAQAKGGGEV